MRYHIFIISILTAAAPFANAAFKIKPGLWELRTTTAVKGKSISTSGQLSKTMKNLSPSQRKQMEKMMGAKGVSLGENGVKLCHSEATMDENLIKDPQHNCEVKDRKNLADGIKFDIHCKNGSGTAEYHKTSDTSYKGFNEFQSEKGKSRTEFTGKFLSTNCGDVKPLQLVK